jgi:hypothetical protein
MDENKKEKNFARKKECHEWRELQSNLWEWEIMTRAQASLYHWVLALVSFCPHRASLRHPICLCYFATTPVNPRSIELAIVSSTKSQSCIPDYQNISRAFETPVTMHMRELMVSRHIFVLHSVMNFPSSCKFTHATFFSLTPEILSTSIPLCCASYSCTFTRTPCSAHPPPFFNLLSFHWTPRWWSYPMSHTFFLFSPSSWTKHK